MKISILPSHPFTYFLSIQNFAYKIGKFFEKNLGSSKFFLFYALQQIWSFFQLQKSLIYGVIYFCLLIPKPVPVSLQHVIIFFGRLKPKNPQFSGDVPTSRLTETKISKVSSVPKPLRNVGHITFPTPSKPFDSAKPFRNYGHLSVKNHLKKSCFSLLSLICRAKSQQPFEIFSISELHFLGDKYTKILSHQLIWSDDQYRKYK